MHCVHMATDEQDRIDQETRADREREQEGRTRIPRETFEQRRSRWLNFTSAFRTGGAK